MSEEIVKEKIKEIMCKYELYNADFKEEIDSITFIVCIMGLKPSP